MGHGVVRDKEELQRPVASIEVWAPQDAMRQCKAPKKRNGRLLRVDCARQRTKDDQCSSSSVKKRNFFHEKGTVCVLKDVEFLGYRKEILKSNQERSIKAVASRV